jgi:deoxyribodipyrimidine photo-lyase
VTRRWPAASTRLLTGGVTALSALPIDHRIRPVRTRGGHEAAVRTLRRFVTAKLSGYDAHRNHPDDEGTSRLSPYLHFGHLSAHEVFSAVMTHERWTTRRLGATGAGRREGWWGVSAAAEAFLDHLVVWRELAFNGCEYAEDHASYDSLPEWARTTLAAHRDDPRPQTYTLERLETAHTDDPLWNAIQRQLVTEGWFHGYLRMLWGKKILEWTRDPRAALEVMIELNNRWALDGRNPNSYSGIFWTLGRYDRPWGPERAVFGTVRYMSSENTARKVRVRDYLAQYADQPTLWASAR